MGDILIGDVCAMLRIKPHVLRYWEQHLQLLNPVKNRGGRRVYTIRDVQLLFRFKYLVYNRMYTLGGAAHRLIEETYGPPARYKPDIQLLRERLLVLLNKVRSDRHHG